MINRKIEYFLTLAEVLSFTQAAAIHNVSQTAISQYIANLEDRLGVKLFRRSPHAVTLTEEGKYYYQQVKIILQIYDDTRDHLQNISESFHGAVKVGIGLYEYCGTEQFFYHFLSCHPEIKVDIYQYMYSELSEKLRVGELDLIISLDLGQNSFSRNELQTRTLFESRNLLVVSRRIADTYETLDAESLLKKECLITNCEDNGPSSLQMLRNLLIDTIGFVPERIEQTNSINAQLMMVRACQGIAIVPDFVAEEQGTDLIRIPLPRSEKIPYKLMKLRHNTNDAANIMFHFSQPE